MDAIRKVLELTMIRSSEKASTGCSREKATRNHARNGEEALSKPAQRKRYDVVFTTSRCRG